MTIEEIKNILNKYWNCETNRAEEEILRKYFSKENVDKDLECYKSLFQMKKSLQSIKADDILKQKIKNAIKKKKERKDFKVVIYQFTKIAACALVVLSFGIGLRTHYKQQEVLDEKFSETYTNPDDAMEETKDILNKVSTSLKNNPEIESTLVNDSDSIGSVEEE